jgi:hypothetical protein
MELNMKTLIAALTFTVLIATPPAITSAAAEFADNSQARQNDNQTYKGYPLRDWYSHNNNW